MNKIKVLSLLLIGALAACTPKNEDKKNSLADKPVKVEDPAVSEFVVLNPNFATKEELLNIPQLEEQHVEAIVSGRPFLNSSDFIALMRAHFPEEVVSDINYVLFLPANLNTAAEDVFMSIPGVGEKMAHEFEEYRPYKSAEQFRREIGKYVDEKEVARFENYVFVPVDLNKSSREEILAIPGVGDRMLHEFEEYRPYKNIEQFRREIGKYVDDKELARLERYVTINN